MPGKYVATAQQAGPRQQARTHRHTCCLMRRAPSEETTRLPRGINGGADRSYGMEPSTSRAKLPELVDSQLAQVRSALDQRR